MKYIVYISILILLTSCDLITTREAEEPIKPSSSFLTATSPEILLQNFESSIEEKITENYLACFVDKNFLDKEYKFVPAGQAVAANPALLNWDLNSERLFMENLKANLSEGKNISLSLNNLNENRFSDSAIYVFDYTLLINTTNKALAGEYKGTSQLSVYKDSREQWVIVEWRDYKSESSQCWSELKGRITN
ncbi:hypothetical protein [Melioribacter sp. OK-6-Me]|uniref:hypothetical protein n=1 Tax=unclassified Melioribacter TaxID=2627329 RepID=UPI003ED9B35E